jgi:phage shock protein C
MNSRYALDKKEAKLLGVCAGLARTTGWDPMLVRVGAVLATFFLFGPFAVLIYLVVALVAETR